MNLASVKGGLDMNQIHIAIAVKMMPNSVLSEMAVKIITNIRLPFEIALKYQ